MAKHTMQHLHPAHSTTQVSLPNFKPLQLGQRPQPFAHADWLYELKWDGFRSLAYVERGSCELWSRNDNRFSRFTPLNVSLAALKVTDAILDGEIVCLDESGKADFGALLFNRSELYFYAFDLLWLNGCDLRNRRLVERKHVLREALRGCDPYVRYVEHFDEREGIRLFDLCFQHDLEGIVAKRRNSTYIEADHATAWIKIKNRNSTKAQDRGELLNPKKKPAGKVDIPQFRCGGY
jgi:bifunctional non-homologous end joining protein LigD